MLNHFETFSQQGLRFVHLTRDFTQLRSPCIQTLCKFFVWLGSGRCVGCWLSPLLQDATDLFCRSDQTFESIGQVGQVVHQIVLVRTLTKLQVNIDQLFLQSLHFFMELRLYNGCLLQVVLLMCFDRRLVLCLPDQLEQRFMAFQHHFAQFVARLNQMGQCQLGFFSLMQEQTKPFFVSQ